MAGVQLRTVFARLQKWLNARDEGVGDGELLERFGSGRDEAAFAALLNRHGGMVLGVCRRVLNDPNDVDDVFQATFLVLARKAGSIRNHRALPGWLYRVAYRLAVDTKQAAVRRRLQERQAPIMTPQDTTAKVSWRELRAILDEELDALPDKYRLPLVLCYLEGRTHAEAARRLGWPKGTVAGRLARARVALRKRLTRRGLTLSSVLLATLLGENAVPAAIPSAVAGSTLRAALAIADKGLASAAVSAKAAALADGFFRNVLLGKLKVGVLLLVTGLVCTGVTWHTLRKAEAGGYLTLADGPQAAPQTDAKPKSQAGSKVTLNLDDILDQARAAAKTTENPHALLGEIATVRAKGGNRALAQQEFAEVLQILGTRATAGQGLVTAITLASLGHDQFRAGARDDARATLKQALQIARTIGKDNVRNDALQFIARTQAEFGEIEGALDTGRSVQPDLYKDQVLADVAIAQVREGDLKGGLATVNALGPLGRTVAWLGIAKLQAPKDPRGALASLGQARSSADSLTEEAHKPIQLGEIALLQGQLVDEATARKTIEEADAIATRVRAGFNKNSFLIRLAIAKAQRGERPAAKKILDEVAKDLDTEGDLPIEAHIAMGDFRAAYQQIHKPSWSEMQRGESLHDLARAQAQAGDTAGAYGWAAQETGGLKAWALLGVAEGMIQATEGAKSRPASSVPTAEDARTRTAPIADHSQEYFTLTREHDDALRKLEAIAKMKTPQERQELMEQELARRFLDLAHKYKDEPWAVDALERVLQFNADGPLPKLALETMLQDHLTGKNISRVLALAAHSTHQKLAEKLLRAVLAENPDRGMRGQACLSLARLLQTRSVRIRFLTESADSETSTVYRQIFGDEHFRELRAGNPQQVLAQAEQHFERVLTDYADVKVDGRLLGEAAKAALFEIRSLRVGAWPRTSPVKTSTAGRSS
jgi:RNA polymerase sigma factor (sigma-70 family)